MKPFDYNSPRWRRKRAAILRRDQYHVPDVPQVWSAEAGYHGSSYQACRMNFRNWLLKMIT